MLWLSSCIALTMSYHVALVILSQHNNQEYINVFYNGRLVYVSIAVTVCTVLLSLWLMFSTGQACSDGNCTLQSTGNFTADCDNGFMEDYLSCLTEMNCPKNVIISLLTTKIPQAYPTECAGGFIAIKFPSKWINQTLDVF